MKVTREEVKAALRKEIEEENRKQMAAKKMAEAMSELDIFLGG